MHSSLDSIRARLKALNAVRSVPIEHLLVKEHEGRFRVIRDCDRADEADYLAADWLVYEDLMLPMMEVI